MAGLRFSELTSNCWHLPHNERATTTLYAFVATFGSPTARLAARCGPGGVCPSFGGAMSMQWAALHDAAEVIALLAGKAAEPMRPEVRNFPATMRDAGGWRRALAQQGVADLAAIMEPGIAALLAVQARGVNPAAPAQALLQEFQSARDGLLCLVPSPDAAPPPRRFT
jgi:hypothetical protein